MGPKKKTFQIALLRRAEEGQRRDKAESKEGHGRAIEGTKEGQRRAEGGPKEAIWGIQDTIRWNKSIL